MGLTLATAALFRLSSATLLGISGNGGIPNFTRLHYLGLWLHWILLLIRKLCSVSLLTHMLHNLVRFLLYLQRLGVVTSESVRIQPHLTQELRVVPLQRLFLK